MGKWVISLICFTITNSLSYWIQNAKCAAVKICCIVFLLGRVFCFLYHIHVYWLGFCIIFPVFGPVRDEVNSSGYCLTRNFIILTYFSLWYVRYVHFLQKWPWKLHCILYCCAVQGKSHNFSFRNQYASHAPNLSYTVVLCIHWTIQYTSHLLLLENSRRLWWQEFYMY